MRTYLLLIVIIIICVIAEWNLFFKIFNEDKASASNENISEIEKIKRNLINFVEDNKIIQSEINFNTYFTTSDHIALITNSPISFSVSNFDAITNITNYIHKWKSAKCAKINSNIDNHSIDAATNNKEVLWEKYRCSFLKQLPRNYFSVLPYATSEGYSFSFIYLINELLNDANFDASNFLLNQIDSFGAHEVRLLSELSGQQIETIKPTANTSDARSVVNLLFEAMSFLKNSSIKNDKTNISSFVKTIQDLSFISQTQFGSIQKILNQNEIIINEQFCLINKNQHDHKVRMFSEYKSYYLVPIIYCNQFFYSSQYSVSAINNILDLNTNNKKCFFYDSRNQLCFNKIENENENNTLKYLQITYLLLATFLIILATATVILFLRIKEQIDNSEKKKFLLQILAHELRTPITTLMLEIDAIKKAVCQQKATSDHLLESLTTIEALIYRLKRLATNSSSYLSFASHNRKNSKLFLNNVNVASINSFLESVIWEFSQNSLQYGNPKIDIVPLDNDCKNDFSIVFDPYWLQIAITNLIENAAKHGVPPISVLPTITNKKHKCFLSIEIRDNNQALFKNINELKTVSPESKDCIGQSKLKHSKGLGIGIDLVFKIIKEMNGKISFKSPPTSFIIHIPIEKNNL